MRINLSRLSGNAEDNKELLHIDGDLPKKRRNLIGPFEGTARIEPTRSPAFDIDGRWIQSILLAG